MAIFFLLRAERSEDMQDSEMESRPSRKTSTRRRGKSSSRKSTRSRSKRR